MVQLVPVNYPLQALPQYQTIQYLYYNCSQIGSTKIRRLKFGQGVDTTFSHKKHTFESHFTGVPKGVTPNDNVICPSLFNNFTGVELLTTWVTFVDSSTTSSTFAPSLAVYTCLFPVPKFQQLNFQPSPHFFAIQPRWKTVFFRHNFDSHTFQHYLHWKSLPCHRLQ